MTFMPSTSAWLRTGIKAGEQRLATPDFGPQSSRLDGNGPFGRRANVRLSPAGREYRSSEPPGDPNPSHSPQHSEQALPRADMTYGRHCRRYFPLVRPLAFSRFNEPMRSRVQRRLTAISQSLVAAHAHTASDSVAQSRANINVTHARYGRTEREEIHQ